MAGWLHFHPNAIQVRLGSLPPCSDGVVAADALPSEAAAVVLRH